MRILALSLFLLSLSAAELPPSAKPAVEAYDAKVAKLKADFDKAVAKETEAFAAALAKAQEAETKKGNLDGALAIRTRLDELPRAPKAETPKAQPLTIDGTSKEGATVGPVQAGQTVSFQYVSGVWKSWGKMASENPDADVQERGDACRVAILLNGRQVGILPPGTIGKPYVWRSPAEGVLTLRINDQDGDWSGNPKGSVVYNIVK